MASVSITLRSGGGDYSVDVDMPETNGQTWGKDQSHLDPLVDEAVRRIKRAYNVASDKENPA